MADSDSERKPEQPQTERLRQEIAQTRKEMAEYERKINEHVAFFERLQIRPFERTTTHSVRYDEMVYFEKKLGLAQQKLASLLLDLLSLFSDQLDKDVKTLSSGISKVKESSRRLENLTYALIFVAIVTFVEAVVRNPPSLLFDAIEVFIAIVLLVAWYRTRQNRSLTE